MLNETEILICSRDGVRASPCLSDTGYQQGDLGHDVVRLTFSLIIVSLIVVF